MIDLYLREGSEETIEFTLKRGNVPFNLTGKTVVMHRINSLEIKDAFSTADMPPLLVISDGVNGQLKFNPSSTTWKKESIGSEYSLYFDVDVAGKSLFFPEANNINVRISPAF